MTKKLMRVLACLSVCVAAWGAEGGGWSRFRGPNGDGVAAGERLPEATPGSIAWKVATPLGHSSPIFHKGSLYFTGFSGDQLLTLAVDAQTGKQRWQAVVQRTRKEFFDKRNSNASPTPVTDGKRLYVFFPEVGLLAYSLQGKLLWKTPLGPFNNLYGMGASPVLVGGKVVLLCDQSEGSFIAAFDPKNGKQVWRTERAFAVSGHSTPSVYRDPASNEDWIIAPGSFRVEAYAAASGERVWWFEGLPSEMKAGAVLSGAHVLISGYNLAENEPGRQVRLPEFAKVLAEHDKNRSGTISIDESPDAMTKKYFPFVDLNHNGEMDGPEWEKYAAAFAAENSLLAIPLAGKGDKTMAGPKWKVTRSIPQLPTVVVYQGVVYMINDSGILSTIDDETGTIWKQARLTKENYYASPIAADGKVVLLSEAGTLSILKAGKEQELLQRMSLDEPCYATPAVAEGRMYIRTQNSLLCLATKK